MLYDANGQWLKVADYDNAAMTMTGVADGTYTLITMAKSPIYNKVSSLDVLDASGLADGKSYASNRVTVKSGEVATVSVDEVPLLNVSQSNYLSTSAVFESNKTNIVAGNYITLRGKALFADAYKNDVSNISMVVELPASAKFVEGSVMVGNEVLSSCKPTNGRIVIPVSNPSDLVRFCVIPTESGDYTPTAMAQFTYQGAERVQLIGNATYTVENLSISVPAEVARTKFRVAGAALANSEVSVYDGETLIGQTTTNAFGSWDLMVELQNPYNLSRHAIYAVINTVDGLSMKTESAIVSYDKNAIEVETVNMTISNHVVDDMHITFDYKTGKTSRSYYDFWGNDAFTFIVNLTNNDPALVKWVNVHVYTEGGGVTILPATYVAHQDRWVAASYFDDHKPINVGVDFEAKTEKKVSLQKYYEAMESIKATREWLQKRMTLAADVNSGKITFEQMFDELGEENPLETPVTIDFSQYTHAELQEIVSKYTDPDKLQRDIQESSEYLYKISTLFEDFTNGNINLGNGVVATVKTCDGIDFSQLSSEDYSIFDTEDGNKLYFYMGNENKYVFINTSTNTYIEYEFNAQTKTRAEDGDVSDRYAKMFELPFEMPSSIEAAVNAALTVEAWITKAHGCMTKFVDDGLKFVADKLYDATFAFEAAKTLRDESRNTVKGLEASLKTATDAAAKAKIQADLNIARTNLEGAEDAVKTLLKSKNDWKWASGAVAKFNTFVGKYMPLLDYLAIAMDLKSLVYEFKDLYERIPDPCPDDSERAERLMKDIVMGCCVNFSAYCGKVITKGMADCFTVLQLSAAVPSGSITVYSAILTFIARSAAGFILDLATDWVKNKTFENLTQRYVALQCNDRKKHNNYKGNGGGKIGNEDIAPRADPSGFVYEAVSSNRVEGVTASVYYKETYEDIYGDQKEKEVLWDAEKYAQENPQFTDADGMYCWMVPSGMWRVKFEKAGYETTHSEWLPVPPPQLDVNVPISQLTAPEVVQAHAYANSVEFKFDKYMIPSTLSANNVVKVTQNGSAVSGTITALNEEACYKGSDTKYASAFCFNASKAFDTTKPVTLTVTSSAQSYADIKMQEDYTVNLNIEEHLTGIETESSLNLNPGETKSIVVSVLPAATAKGKTLIVKPSTEAIASVDAKEYTLNANGQATVNITANSIGGTSLKFSVANYDVTARTEVNVVDKYQKVQAPKASIASGSMLPYLTPVTLSCSTPNSTILYTTDGSCPCDNGADVKTYEGNPIILTKNMTLKAMAVVKGMIESEVSEFSYSIDPTGIADVKAVDVKISPTITNDIVNVEVGNEQPAEITVYNIGGQVVLRSNITHSATISLAPQPDGIYFLSVSQDSAVTVEKIIKD